MITWEYRLFRDQEGYHIREVFYNDNGEIAGCTKDAVVPTGNTPNELAEQIEEFKLAMQKPALTLDDMPKIPSEHLQKCNLQDWSNAVLQEQLMAELGIVVAIK